MSHDISGKLILNGGRDCWFKGIYGNKGLAKKIQANNRMNSKKNL